MIDAKDKATTEYTLNKTPAGSRYRAEQRAIVASKIPEVSFAKVAGKMLEQDTITTGQIPTLSFEELGKSLLNKDTQKPN